MIVDFFRHGRGLSKGCLDYLLGEDRDRENARILSGDIGLTAQLIDSSYFAKKYTSGCLSFYEYDLSDEDKQKIMQNFEECLFPGLDKDQYQILWVQHQDKVNEDTGQTRLELNFIIPNVELSTGKRLQPFYAPADLTRVDLFKRITNAEHKLYDPDDPDHQQLLINKKNLPKDVKDFKEQLHQRIYREINNGNISDRQELVNWLESNQIQVTRQVKKSISIENPYEDAKRPIRLEGEIYEQGFRATEEYRHEVQQRIAEYSGTAEERYRRNIEDYQRQLDHKSQYHSERYSTVGRENSSEDREYRTDSREAVEPVSSLARIEIEPFISIKREYPNPRTRSSESKSSEKTYSFEYGTDVSSSYFSYSHFITEFYQQEQIQRAPEYQSDSQREANDNRSLEQFRGESELEYLYQTRHESKTPMHSDEQESWGMAERLYDSDGVLSNDSVRSSIIENYRRTTRTIANAAKAIADATRSFRELVKTSLECIISTVDSNQQRTRELETNTNIIRNNTSAILRAREEYSDLYQADQWKSQRDEPDHSRQRRSAGENLNRTEFSIVASDQSSEELTRNLRDIEESLRTIVEQKLERQKVVDEPRSKQDRGMDFF